MATNEYYTLFYRPPVRKFCNLIKPHVVAFTHTTPRQRLLVTPYIAGNAHNRTDLKKRNIDPPEYFLVSTAEFVRYRAGEHQLSEKRLRIKELVILRALRRIHIVTVCVSPPKASVYCEKKRRGTACSAPRRRCLGLLAWRPIRLSTRADGKPAASSKGVIR